MRGCKKLIGKTVLVIWKDPETTGGWVTKKQLKESLPKIRTYGVLISISKKMVVLASTVSDDGQHCDMFKFPTGTVIDIREVS